MAEARLTHDLSSPVPPAPGGAPRAADGPVDRFKRRVRAVNDRYASEQPLPAFAGIIATYSSVVLAVSTVAWRQGRLSDRVPAQDLVLYSIATHKVARIIASEWAKSRVLRSNASLASRTSCSTCCRASKRDFSFCNVTERGNLSWSCPSDFIATSDCAR